MLRKCLFIVFMLVFFVLGVGCPGTSTDGDGGVSDPAEAGQLGGPCLDSSPQCSSGLDCCADVCVDTGSNPSHCGSCGSACGGASFCSSASTCNAETWANLCSNTNIVALSGMFADDNAATGDIAARLGAACAGSNVTQAQQEDDEVIHQLTGQSLLPGGTTIVAAGGGSGQSLIQYATDARLARVRVDGVGSAYNFVLQSAPEPPIFSLASDALTVDHDAFIIDLYSEPENGALIVSAQGLLSGGTFAARQFFNENIAPNLASEASTWFVVEWVDANGNGPDAADTYTIHGQGS